LNCPSASQEYALKSKCPKNNIPQSWDPICRPKRNTECYYSDLYHIKSNKFKTQNFPVKSP
jgi:hypothetical protein